MTEWSCHYFKDIFITCVCMHVWTSQDKQHKSVLCVGPGDGTQVVRFGGRRHYPQVHLSEPHLLITPFLKTTVRGSGDQDICTSLWGMLFNTLFSLTVL